MSKKKAQSLTPRRKRYARVARLLAAKQWLIEYTGRNLLRGYMKYFGVDFECAVREFGLLGVSLDQDYVLQVRRSIAGDIKKRLARKQERLQAAYQANAFECDCYFFEYSKISGESPTPNGSHSQRALEELDDIPF